MDKYTRNYNLMVNDVLDGIVSQTINPMVYYYDFFDRIEKGDIEKTIIDFMDSIVESNKQDYSSPIDTENKHIYFNHLETYQTFFKYQVVQTDD